MKVCQTVGDLLEQVKNHQNPKALSGFIDDHWLSYSTDKVLELIETIALSLISLGVKKGQNIGLMCLPSPEWTMIDFAIMSIGCVSVPLFANISDENFNHEVNETDIKILFFSGEEPSAVYQSHKHMFDVGIGVNEKGDKVLEWEEFLQKGRALKESEPNKFQTLLSSLTPDQTATIIYTSGSTGLPKGAELSHKAIVSLTPFDQFEWNIEQDRYLSILPLAHVFGRVINVLFFYLGISIYYFNDVKKISLICQDLHPTILVVVPRLLERIYSRMLSKVQESGYIKRQIGLWAFNLAHQEKEDFYKLFMHPIADSIVYSSLREAFGGQVRIVVSGGAALNPHLCHFFIDIGIPIFEGWGMTESCPVTVNTEHFRKIGTVGKPVIDMQIKIGKDQEVLVKGSNVMKGYYKNEEMTKNTFDEDGWLKTGDKGKIDEEGYLILEGRLKEMLKTSTGEYVVPVPIEQMLTRARFVDLAQVIAEGRKFASVLIFPNLDVIHALKNETKMSNLSDEEFLQSDYIKNEMEKVLEQINLHLNHWEQIHDYRFILDQLTVEAGDLTPSMKLRRQHIEKKYENVISGIYAEESSL
ncbi:Long-chain-fatty-acid--CoA ligase FadD15 [Candidatus Rubidus massiliensis]|nr:MAG: hypothetical protein BGO10_05925 [Chlamydia sp. 32-24]CDZ81773.1 Long-chain-fatty-acid--CoA ligase FadD15 [Candidatus Rubidus massiliensis]